MVPNTPTTAVIRLEFDTTLDDYVDTNVRVANQSKTFRRQRVIYQCVTGIFCAAAFIAAVVALSSSRPVLTAAASMAVVAVAVVLGAIVGYAARRYFDWRIRRYYRRMCRDLLDGRTNMRFELELRQSGVWTRCRDVETSYAWSRLTNITETPDSIELWFGPGLVVVRNRAFATNDARLDFLALTRSHRQAA